MARVPALSQIITKWMKSAESTSKGCKSPITNDQLDIKQQQRIGGPSLWTVTESIMNVCGLYYSIVHQWSVILFLSSSSSNLLSRSDRSIYLVATKLHNHFANYFLSSDCAQNHPSSLPPSPWKAISTAASFTANQFQAFLLIGSLPRRFGCHPVSSVQQINLSGQARACNEFSGSERTSSSSSLVMI